MRTRKDRLPYLFGDAGQPLVAGATADIRGQPRRSVSGELLIQLRDNPGIGKLDQLLDGLTGILR